MLPAVRRLTTFERLFLFIVITSFVSCVKEGLSVAPAECIGLLLGNFLKIKIIECNVCVAIESLIRVVVKFHANLTLPYCQTTNKLLPEISRVYRCPFSWLSPLSHRTRLQIMPPKDPRNIGGQRRRNRGGRKLFSSLYPLLMNIFVLNIVAET